MNATALACKLVGWVRFIDTQGLSDEERVNHFTREINDHISTEMNSDELATKILTALSAEKLYKADCFDYLCWLEETHQSENVKGAQFLVLASDGTTCWGHSYSDAVKVAMQHDKELFDAVKEFKRNIGGVE